MRRRSLLGAAMVLPAAQALQAQGSYPSSAIKVIVPLGAGGTYDIVARTVADDLGKQFNVPIVVENKPGGNYVIGMRALATAKPDGYTIGVSAGSILSQTPIIFPEAALKLEDYEPVAPLVSVRTVLAVSASLSVKDLAGYIRYAKASKEPTLLGTTGVGSVSHLAIVELGKEAGFSVEAVPYLSNPASLNALRGGHVPAVSGLLGTFIEQHRAGRVRIVAYSGEKRHPAIPEVQTFAEAGFPGLTRAAWAAMFAPLNTPAHVVDRLHKAIVTATARPAFKQKLPIDVEPFFATSAELRDMAIKDREYWRRFFSDPEMLKRVKGA